MAQDIFGNAGHNLGPVVAAAGGQTQAATAIATAAQQAANTGVIGNGLFETAVNVAGHTVTVRGNVINGVVNVATAFIP